MKSNIPDSLTIQQYLEGKLDSGLAHQLEKQALDDPFLWEALEGYSVYKDPAADLSILQRQLHERIVHLQENKKVFDLSWQRLSVAAAAAVMFVSAGILFWMNSQKSPEQLASQLQKPVEVNVIDRDSVESVIRTEDKSVTATFGRDNSDLDRPGVAVYNPVKSQKKSEIKSPESGNTIVSSAKSASQIETQTRAVAAASAVPEVGQGTAARSGNAAGEFKEVAVTKYNNAPKSGWLPYREYLDQNTKKFVPTLRLSGSVLVSFKVGSDGKLSEIKVIESMSEIYDREAVRIIRNGSDWTPLVDGKPYETQLEVSFK